MDKKQTVLFLMRHGKTGISTETLERNEHLSEEQIRSFDRQRVLTEEGREECRKVGQYLRAFGPVAIYSSPLERTLQTAEILKTEAEIPGEIHTEESLQDFLHFFHDPAHGPERLKFIHSLVAKYAGEQIVVVSHLNPIIETLNELGFQVNGLEMGQGYRVVFAGETAVETVKINPAII